MDDWRDPMENDSRMEEILKRPYYVLDIFPHQVPEDKQNVFMEVEEYFLLDRELEVITEKFIRIVLKAICYFPYEIYDKEWLGRMDAARLAKRIEKIMLSQQGFLNVLLCDNHALLQVEGGSLYMTVYNADNCVEKVMRKLALSEGLFWRKGCD